MKQKIKLVAALGIAVLLAACSNDDDYSYSNVDNTSAADVIVKERDANLPEAITKDIVLEHRPATRANGQNGEIIGNSDVLLGYSYTIGSSIMGEYSNVISPIVDISKVKALDPEYIIPKLLNTNFTRSFAYSNFDRYESNSTVTKKVTTGFSLNIKLFKLGRKKTTTEVFTSQITNSNNSVFGELNLDIKNSSFQLQGSDGARKLYARECLSNTFMKNIYSSTIGEILNRYGDFVLTGYITGGKAFGFYAGLAAEGSDTQKKEKDMNTDINASFSWKSNSASGNLNFGKGNSNLTSSGYSTKQSEIQIRTYGGKQSGQAVVGAVSLENMQLDLSSWLNSLSNVNTHTIIDVLDQGLYPLSYFVLEENFKRRFDDTYRELLEKRTKLIDPFIEVVKVYVRTSSSGEPLYDVAAVLNTRQGDKIVLSDGKAATASDAELRANNNNTTYTQKVNAIVAQKRNYFGLAFKSNAGTKLNPAMRTPLCIGLKEFNETRMFRYTNPKTGMEYIYDTTKRIAFSHLTDRIDGDWILDHYGIRDWVESLPTKSISMATLANSYTIIGL